MRAMTGLYNLEWQKAIRKPRLNEINGNRLGRDEYHRTFLDDYSVKNVLSFFASLPTMLKSNL